MEWVLGIGAVLCIAYYIVILCYSGITTSFAFIWLVFAAILVSLVLGIRYYQESPTKGPLWIPVSLATICITALTVFVIVEVLVFTGVTSPDTPNLDYLIVLGAKVKEEEISNSLKYRLDKAIEYSKENPDAIFLLSGGKGKDEPMTEAIAMKRYLTRHGLKEEQILLEEQSTSTVENIAYSKLLIESHVKEEKERKIARMKLEEIGPKPFLEVPDKPISIGVLTSNFHVFRAKQIARKWGIPDIYGIASDTDPILFLHLCVRECVAILKDKLMGNM